MRNISDLHPRLQAKLAELQTLCSNQGITIKIGECLRTTAEQDALYAKGRTTPGSIVTNAKGSSYSSQHQWGIAADFYLDMDIDEDGSKSDDAFNNVTGLFDKTGALAKSIGLGWGGDWKSPVDKPHLYLPDWGSTPTRLKNQYGTPENFIKTWTDTSVSSNTNNNAASSAAASNAASSATAGNAASSSAAGNAASSSAKEIIRAGQVHANTFANAGITADGIRGPKTKKAGIKVLQTALNLDYHANLAVDGIFGSKSRQALGTHFVKRGETQYLVTALEILLMLKGINPKGVEYPGIFGSGLDTALKQYQKDNGLTVDGKAGVKTFTSLIS